MSFAVFFKLKILSLFHSHLKAEMNFLYLLRYNLKAATARLSISDDRDPPWTEAINNKNNDNEYSDHISTN